MLLIFAISSVSNLPAVPGNPSDKIEHFAEYGVLGVLLVRALGGRKWGTPTIGTAAIAVVIAVVYGLSDEGHQYFVPGRQSDWHDALADAIGAGAASAAVYAWGIITRFFRSDRDAV
jgi:VanZ family protein